MKKELIKTLKCFLVAIVILAVVIGSMVGFFAYRQKLTSIPKQKIVVITKTNYVQQVVVITNIVPNDFDQMMIFARKKNDEAWRKNNPWGNDPEWKSLSNKVAQICEKLPLQQKEIGLIQTSVTYHHPSQPGVGHGWSDVGDIVFSSGIIEINPKRLNRFNNEEIARIKTHNDLFRLIMLERESIGEFENKMRVIESDWRLKEFYKSKTN